MSKQNNRTARISVLIGATFMSALALATPSSAYAQEFEGPWIGVTGGYDTFDAGEGSDGEDGIVYGIAAGYDFDLGSVVVGLEAEVSDSSVEATAEDVIQDGDTLSLDAGRDLYAGVRVGLPVSDNLMLYAKAGYTNQRFSAAYTLGDTTENESDNLDGFRIGGGGEVKIGAGFGRLEYRYSEYGSFSDTDLETSRHQVVATAGIRF